MSQQLEPWFRIATRSAVQIRKRFGIPDQSTADRIVRVFRAALRPRARAGRRPADETVRAVALWVSGMKHYSGITRRRRLPLGKYQRALWQRIYREVLDGFAAMDKLTRQYRTATLRRNVKAYLRRREHKLANRIRVSTAMSPRNRVLSLPSSSPAE